ncbi:sperm flagellar protein 1-like isoform X1 [Leptopilina boulardi]|uniref:sperm flagellar protein 1-like isoform X1 n=2 Tax=Leptopilina boulardi TaxID=63433 RepID=UPI0021F58132|nr:sperm flagellar protein 1-like isoform X1 [Leptopilina boulardi]
MSFNAEKGDDFELIYSWLDGIPFSRPKKNTSRDFSDGVLMAELLKRYYPRLVDVYNYIPGNSIAKKIDNWCTLNRKVLSKIDMKLSKETIDRLANSQNGVIEKVLNDLRVKILKDSNTDSETLYSEAEEKGKGESTRNYLNPELLTNKTVPRLVFMQLKQELQEKNNAISILSEKVSALESQVEIKDQRIYDLTAQILSTNQIFNAPIPASRSGTSNKLRKSNTIIN